MTDFSFKGLIIDYIKANPEQNADALWHDSDNPYNEYWKRDSIKHIKLSDIDLDSIGMINYGGQQLYSTVTVYVKLHNDNIKYRINILMQDIFGFLNGKINQLRIDKEKDKGITIL